MAHLTCGRFEGRLLRYVQPMIVTALRHATGFKRRIRKQEELNKMVFQYAKNSLRKSDRIYTWGYAATGALGVHKFLQPKGRQRLRQVQSAPYRLEFFDKKIKVKHVAAGNGFTLFACQGEGKQHKLYGTGINTDLQLGYQKFPKYSGSTPDYLIEPSPVMLPLQSDTMEPKITHVACGRAHSVVVTERGIYTLGNNAAGQCGQPIVEGSSKKYDDNLKKLHFEKTVKEIVCGQDHTMILTTGGEIYSCGLGADGQTGLGHYDNTSELTKVKGDIENENIVQISCKGDCVLAISDKGEVFGWGNSEYDQLSAACPGALQINQPAHLPFKGFGKVTKVASAGAMCALVNDAGHVFVWGFGLLGKGPQTQTSSWPIQIPPALFGKTEFQDEIVVVDIQCGMNFMGAITGQYELFMWGNNRLGSLGLGHTRDQYFPFQVHLPAEIRSLTCGIDHCIASCKTFL